MRSIYPGGGPPGKTIPFSSTINTDAADRYTREEHRDNINHSTAGWMKGTQTGKDQMDKNEADWGKRDLIVRDKDGKKVNPGPGGPYINQSHDITDLKGLVYHQTGVRYGDALKKAHNWAYKGKGLHILIGQNGKINVAMPPDLSGVHVGGPRTDFSRKNDLSNYTTLGVELEAKNDEDVTPEQVQSALYLAKYLGFEWDQLYRHPELRTGKKADEGRTVLKWLAKLGVTDKGEQPYKGNPGLTNPKKK